MSDVIEFLFLRDRRQRFQENEAADFGVGFKGERKPGLRLQRVELERTRGEYCNNDVENNSQEY